MASSTTILIPSSLPPPPPKFHHPKRILPFPQSSKPPSFSFLTLSPPKSPSNPTFHPPSSSSSSSSVTLPPQNHNHYLLHPPDPPDSNEEDALSARYHYLLRLAIDTDDIQLGHAIHASISKTHQDNTHLHNSLISMYLKLGSLTNARKIFNSLSSPDIVSFSTMISAYAKCFQEAESIRLFFRMRHCSGIEPNEFALVAVLTACIRTLNSQLGSQIHVLAFKLGYILCVYVSNAIMGLYVKCGLINPAIQLFDEMPQRDVASWNTVISGLVKESDWERAFELFREMQVNGFRADPFSLSSLLIAAAEALARSKGKEVHAHALRIGFELNISVNNALIGFYTKCGNVEDVVGLFRRMSIRDVISWTGMVTGFMKFGLVESAVEVFNQMPGRNCVSYNALLAGFCLNGEASRALEFFRGMVEDGVELSDFTLTSVVNACGMLSKMEESEQIHAFVLKVGFGYNARIEAALLDMCTKCGRIADADKMFSRWVHDKSHLIAWTSLICGYARNGQPDKAMALFCAMHMEEELIMDEFVLATILSVFGTLGFDRMGKQIHCHVVKYGLLSDLAVGNASISMYSKCGNMEDAIKIFNLMPERDIVSWNTLIAGHLLHRQGDKALDVWTKMENMGPKPDHITFISILSSCRYTKSKSVDTCRTLFHSMKSNYGIEPTSEHYAAMVDVLGYWGCFNDAEELIKNMCFKPDALVWRALLDSCRLRSNMILGRQAAQHLLTLEPRDPSMYVLVSNLYSASGRWHCSERVREDMREKGWRKHPARSWIIHQDRVHSFYTRDRSHSQAKDILSGLEILIVECLKVGYVPDTSFVLHEVEEYQKKDFLFYHSAKLAATYGLLMTVPGRPVRVMKNINLCGDCHTFLKCVSSVTGREIYVRDSTGFHYFRSGECSCGDYW
ncbi:pentatricopeptide repeat (PPR) superfamily protein [Tasmannia lanceolata]|uniref:pentatricopeptide repeat (PPR) superfamily protein n=1 Tax=Tasmannia lanceolata TaxID=3420 RepID=UPI004063F152